MAFNNHISDGHMRDKWEVANENFVELRQMRDQIMSSFHELSWKTLITTIGQVQQDIADVLLLSAYGGRIKIRDQNDRLINHNYDFNPIETRELVQKIHTYLCRHFGLSQEQANEVTVCWAVYGVRDNDKQSLLKSKENE